MAKMDSRMLAKRKIYRQNTVKYPLNFASSLLYRFDARKIICVTTLICALFHGLSSIMDEMEASTNLLSRLPDPPAWRTEKTHFLWKFWLLHTSTSSVRHPLTDIVTLAIYLFTHTQIFAAKAPVNLRPKI